MLNIWSDVRGVLLQWNNSRAYKHNQHPPVVDAKAFDYPFPRVQAQNCRGQGQCKERKRHAICGWLESLKHFNIGGSLSLSIAPLLLAPLLRERGHFILLNVLLREVSSFQPACPPGPNSRAGSDTRGLGKPLAK